MGTGRDAKAARVTRMQERAREKAAQVERIRRLAASFALLSAQRYADAVDRSQARDQDKKAIEKALEEAVCKKPDEDRQFDEMAAPEAGLEEFSTLDIVLLFAPVGRAFVWAGKGLAFVGARAAGMAAKLLVPMRLAVKTPYGSAIQQLTWQSWKLKSAAKAGMPIYRQGRFFQYEKAVVRNGVALKKLKVRGQFTGEGQFWLFDNPAATASFAEKAGMYGTKAEWMIQARLKESATVIIRKAPGSPLFKGGGTEAVTKPGTVRLDWFHMPD